MICFHEERKWKNSMNIKNKIYDLNPLKKKGQPLYSAKIETTSNHSHGVEQ